MAGQVESFPWDQAANLERRERVRIEQGGALLGQPMFLHVFLTTEGLIDYN